MVKINSAPMTPRGSDVDCHTDGPVEYSVTTVAVTPSAIEITTPTSPGRSLRCATLGLSVVHVACAPSDCCVPPSKVPSSRKNR